MINRFVRGAAAGIATVAALATPVRATEISDIAQEVYRNGHPAEFCMSEHAEDEHGFGNSFYHCINAFEQFDQTVCQELEDLGRGIKRRSCSLASQDGTIEALATKIAFPASFCVDATLELLDYNADGYSVGDQAVVRYTNLCGDDTVFKVATTEDYFELILQQFTQDGYIHSTKTGFERTATLRLAIWASPLDDIYEGVTSLDSDEVSEAVRKLIIEFNNNKELLEKQLERELALKD